MFNGLATASLLLSVATVVLWVYSRNNDDRVLFGAKGRQWEARSERGLFTFAVSRSYVTAMDDLPPFAGRKETGFPSTGIYWEGVGIGRSMDGWWTDQLKRKCPATGFAMLHFWQPGDGDIVMDLFECRVILIRDWLLACVLALLPAVWIVTSIRAHGQARHRRLGHCLRCNYDLTGNVSGRCPECGTPITTLGTKSIRAR
jgi:hypothetical protein